MSSALSIRACNRRFIDAKISERLSPNTIDFYRINLSHFAGFFPSKKPLAELTRQDIRAFLAFVISEKSAHVGDACYRSVLALFNWLEEEEEITGNPFYRGRQKVIKPPKLPVRAPRRAHPSAVQTLLGSIQIYTWIDARDKAIISLFMTTAMRRGELVKLTTSDIDLVDRMVQVVGKGDKERDLPFATSAAFWLFAYLSSRPPIPNCDALFLSNHIGRLDGYRALTGSGVRQMLIRRCQRAGVDYINPHAMRHGTATAFLNAGADLGFVQELLGHSDPSVTRRVYVEWLKDGFKRSYDAYAGQALG